MENTVFRPEQLVMNTNNGRLYQIENTGLPGVPSGPTIEPIAYSGG
jgi:hypothetical protein